MKVEVLLFAAARQAAGCDRLTVELADGSNVAELRRALAAACPDLAGLLRSSLIAVNHEYAHDTTLVPPEAEVALIPPVSGG